MSRKIEISLTVASLFVALGAWLFPVSSNPLSWLQTGVSSVAHIWPKATLAVTGAGATVTIHKSKAEAEYRGGAVSAPGAEAEIYVPIGQPLAIEITGVGASIQIQSELMPYVEVLNTASGATVRSF